MEISLMELCMKNNKCPNCDSSEIITDLKVRGSGDLPAYVSISEPDPPNKPFIWIPKSEQSFFTASVCGDCGYTELHAINHKALLDGYKKGYKSS